MELSIIIPLFNEEENIEPLLNELYETLDGLGKSYEVIFVDDGSQDETFKRLNKLKNKHSTIIRFTRNFGQSSALQAGFDNAKGDIVITMDGDLQNSPRDIPLLLKKVNMGYDVVSGWRKERKDPFFTRRLPSLIANKIISWVTKVRLHDFGCTLKAYQREAIDGIRLYGEMHRFLPALLIWRGIKITEIEVRHLPRKYGHTKYGLSRTFKVILDVIVVRFFLSGHSTPIQTIGGWGIVSIGAAIVTGIILILMKIGPSKIDMTGNPFLYLTVLFIIVGVQLIILGLLGEIIARAYYESQGKSTYVVKEMRKKIKG